jgi:hypothetical protein
MRQPVRRVKIIDSFELRLRDFWQNRRNTSAVSQNLRNSLGLITLEITRRLENVKVRLA